MNNLLIIFAKNVQLGKVKTRLAKSIGNKGALDVYEFLVNRLEQQTLEIDGCDLRVYYSENIDNSRWNGKSKYVQKGNDLGEKMLNAFADGFNDGYSSIIGVGTDIPDLNSSIINNGFKALKDSQTVFGPAEDGGYYLIGMSKLFPFIFKNKQWSTSEVLNTTLDELKLNEISTDKLIELNDIDTIEDLISSSIANHFSYLTGS